jgi:HSP90 family molecular chaperone
VEFSPFYEPFKGSGVPVLILNNNVDEICFQQIQDYKGKRFVNIETSYEEIAKDIKPTTDDSTVNQGERVPEDDITPFSLWLKNELSSHVTKVTISKRLTGTPAVLFGQMSSSMRVLMQMMDQQQADQ